MYDNMNDKFTTETVTTFDKDYNVLSNGALKSVKTNADGTKTWHYAMSKPHAGYLLMLAIDKYAVKKTKTATGVPVSFWYYPESPEKVEPTSMHTEKMIEFLEYSNKVKELYIGKDTINKVIEAYKKSIIENEESIKNIYNIDKKYCNINLLRKTIG